MNAPGVGPATVSNRLTGRSRSRRWSLGSRLTAWYTASSFLVVLAGMGLIYGALAHNLDREDAEALATAIADVRLAVAGLGPVGGLREEVLFQAPISEPRTYLRVLDADGQVRIATPGMSRLLPLAEFARIPVLDAVGRGTKIAVIPRKLARTAGARRNFLVAAVRMQSLGRGAIIEAALDRSPENKLLGEFRGLMLWVLLLALGSCGGLGYLIARIEIRPLEDIARTATRIGSSNLSERIEAKPLAAELADLAGSLNSMLDRLEAAFERQDRFSADIAHELRTPLNNLRGEIEVTLSRPRFAETYREVLGSSLEEYDRLSQIIDSLLFLARSEDPTGQIDRVELELRDELEAIREYYEAAANEAGVSLEVAVYEPISVPGDRTLLQRAIGNLVSNAIRYTPPGGRVVMSAEVIDGCGEIRVADTGEGIPPEHLPHIFERFYRVAASRTTALGGSGLGLALVGTIASLHGGTVSATSFPGSGTTIALRLPLS